MDLQPYYLPAAMAGHIARFRDLGRRNVFCLYSTTSCRCQTSRSATAIESYGANVWPASFSGYGLASLLYLQRAIG